MAILLWMLTPFDEHSWAQSNVARALLTVLAGVALVVVLPFGVVIAVTVLAGLCLWQIIERRSIIKSPYLFRMLWILIGASPILIYDLWAITNNPGLQAWNAQNLTPSPSPLDFAISFLPVLLFGIPGVISILRFNVENQRVLLVWCVAGVVLLYLPFGLQRRLMLGLMVPFAGLSSLGIQYLARGQWYSQLRWVALLFLLAVPTNLIVLLAGIHGVRTRDSLLYLTYPEIQGLRWIAEQTRSDALVLASPETGLYIPAHAGRRVIYGHPFESLQAEEMESLVISLFNGTASPKDLEILEKIDYVFFGQREARLGEPDFLDHFKVVFQDGDVVIFEKIP
jgi:hypothetical protein